MAIKAKSGFIRIHSGVNNYVKKVEIWLKKRVFSSNYPVFVNVQFLVLLYAKCH